MPSAVLPVEYPDDPAELLDLADQLYRTGRGRAAVAAWQRFDEHHAAAHTDLHAELSDLLAARRADARGRAAANAERFAEAEPAWREAVDGYERAGDEGRRLVAQGRLGALLCQLGRADEGLPMVEESTWRLAASGDPDHRISGELRLAHTYLTLDRIADALQRVEHAARHVGPATEPLLVAEIEERRAQVLLTLGRASEALTAAASAQQRYADVGSPPAIALAHLLYGHAKLGTGTSEREVVEAAEAFAAALAHTERADIRLAAHQARGQALLAAQQPAAAVEHLVEAVAGCVAAGYEAQAGLTHYDLARAYQAAGQPLAAATAAEEALTMLDRVGATGDADRCRYLLAGIYLDLDEAEEALGQLDRLVVNLDGYDNAAARGQMSSDAGHILYRLDRDGPAAQRFAEAADAYAVADQPMDEVRARRWAALSWRWADRSEAALAALAAADATAARLSPHEPAAIWERAMVGYDGTKVLMGADRFDEALVRVAGLAESFRSIEAFGEAHHVELLHGELLLRMSRPLDAEPLLRGVLAAMPRGSQTQQNAAWMLSETLEALGRPDEAAGLRREYRLDEQP